MDWFKVYRKVDRVKIEWLVLKVSHLTSDHTFTTLTKWTSNSREATVFENAFEAWVYARRTGGGNVVEVNRGYGGWTGIDGTIDEEGFRVLEA